MRSIALKPRPGGLGAAITGVDFLNLWIGKGMGNCFERQVG